MISNLLDSLMIWIIILLLVIILVLCGNMYYDIGNKLDKIILNDNCIVIDNTKYCKEVN